MACRPAQACFRVDARPERVHKRIQDGVVPAPLQGVDLHIQGFLIKNRCTTAWGIEQANKLSQWLTQ